jgi:Phosphotransferase enzyme family
LRNDPLRFLRVHNANDFPLPITNTVKNGALSNDFQDSTVNMTTIQNSVQEPGDLIGAGRTADVYAWGNDRVLKLYKSWMPVSVVEREFEVTRAAHQAGLPVPETLQMVERDGCHGIVFERVRGASLMQELQRHPWRLFAIASQLAELHVLINRCPAPESLPLQKEAILSSIERVEGLSPEIKGAALNALAALPAGNSLCHGDFHPDNILLTEHGPMIIDWMTGTRGSPAADLIRTVMILQTSALPPNIPALSRRLLDVFRRLLVAVYRRRYLRCIPLTPSEMSVWQLPLLTARLSELSSYPAEKTAILKRIQPLIGNERH